MHSRERIHRPSHLGETIADAMCSGMGSWRFVLVQTAIVAFWIAANLWLLTHPFDPFPLILLNLVFSTQAAYASPLILMSQNRQATKDRKRDDLEASEVEASFKELEQVRSLLSKQTTILMHIQSEVKEIDTQLHLAPLVDARPALAYIATIRENLLPIHSFLNASPLAIEQQKRIMTVWDEMSKLALLLGSEREEETLE